MQAAQLRQTRATQAALAGTPPHVNQATQLLASLSPAALVSSKHTLHFGSVSQASDESPAEAGVSPAPLPFLSPAGRASPAATQQRREAEAAAAATSALATPLPGARAFEELVSPPELQDAASPDVAASPDTEQAEQAETRDATHANAGVAAADPDAEALERSAAAQASAPPVPLATPFAAQSDVTAAWSPGANPAAASQQQRASSVAGGLPVSRSRLASGSGATLRTPPAVSMRSVDARPSDMQLLASQALLAASVEPPASQRSLSREQAPPSFDGAARGAHDVAAEVLQSSQHCIPQMGAGSQLLGDWEVDAVRGALERSACSQHHDAATQAGAAAAAAAAAIEAQYEREAQEVLDAERLMHGGDMGQESPVVEGDTGLPCDDSPDGRAHLQPPQAATMHQEPMPDNLHGDARGNKGGKGVQGGSFDSELRAPADSAFAGDARRSQQLARDDDALADDDAEVPRARGAGSPPRGETHSDMDVRACAPQSRQPVHVQASGWPLPLPPSSEAALAQPASVEQPAAISMLTPTKPEGAEQAISASGPEISVPAAAATAPFRSHAPAAPIDAVGSAWPLPYAPSAVAPPDSARGATGEAVPRQLSPWPVHSPSVPSLSPADLQRSAPQSAPSVQAPAGAASPRAAVNTAPAPARAPHVTARSRSCWPTALPSQAPQRAATPSSPQTAPAAKGSERTPAGAALGAASSPRKPVSALSALSPAKGRSSPVPAPQPALSPSSQGPGPRPSANSLPSGPQAQQHLPGPQQLIDSAQPVGAQPTTLPPHEHNPQTTLPQQLTQQQSTSQKLTDGAALHARLQASAAQASATPGTPSASAAAAAAPNAIVRNARPSELETTDRNTGQPPRAHASGDPAAPLSATAPSTATQGHAPAVPSPVAHTPASVPPQPRSSTQPTRQTPLASQSATRARASTQPATSSVRAALAANGLQVMRPPAPVLSPLLAAANPPLVIPPHALQQRSSGPRVAFASPASVVPPVLRRSATQPVPAAAGARPQSVLARAAEAQVKRAQAGLAPGLWLRPKRAAPKLAVLESAISNDEVRSCLHPKSSPP